ncbi:TetR/AcrR family transcriptional regulator [Pseudofrankia asymbiotica]|uniref:TetR family transcriptional regulator n=1 Tax=Pseudofrankia asymbiotica TaxID=1834516 RepID=A0A1V2I6K4_9ACTN|nr:TetR/AcrR family transcriptional regulator [Pseudofrankia asymbiotica]ONH25685.1 TetR family transcriptional regulator [Pseudofrankia asymbiotica]
MKEGAATRPYRQRERAATAEATTQRILAVGLELFKDRPIDQITLAEVAERAGVGVQTVIRRVGTKDGLIAAVNAWVGPMIGAARGAPDTADPAEVAARAAHQYERWGDVIRRSLSQEDISPAVAATVTDGRQAHRAWVAQAFHNQLRAVLDAAGPAARDDLLGRLVAVTGAELWHVLRRDGGLAAAAAQAAVADLITACLTAAATAAMPVTSTDRRR